MHFNHFILICPNQFCRNPECNGEGAEPNCDINAVCTNIEGGFMCECKDGWNGDGVSCTGIYYYILT